MLDGLKPGFGLCALRTYRKFAYFVLSTLALFRPEILGSRMLVMCLRYEMGTDVAPLP